MTLADADRYLTAAKQELTRLLTTDDPSLAQLEQAASAVMQWTRIVSRKRADAFMSARCAA